MPYPALAALQRAIRSALRERERRITELQEHDRERAERLRHGGTWAPDWGPYWSDFARVAHDLSAFAAGALRVSPEGAGAALAILHALCDSAAPRGWQVAAKPDGCWLPLASKELDVRATVRERFLPSQLRHETASGLQREEAKAGSGRFLLVIEGLGRTPLEIEAPPEDLERLATSGALFERMHQRAVASRQQQAATAAKRQRLEQEAADAARVRAEADQERARLGERAEHERQAAAAEGTRRDQLLRDVEAWQQAETMRRYVAHAAAAGAKRAWIEWALEIANRIDPLHKG